MRMTAYAVMKQLKLEKQCSDIGKSSILDADKVRTEDDFPISALNICFETDIVWPDAKGKNLCSITLGILYQ